MRRSTPDSLRGLGHALELALCATLGEMRLDKRDVRAGDTRGAHQLLLTDAESFGPVLHRMPVAHVDGGGVLDADLGRGLGHGTPRIAIGCRSLSFSDEESVVHTSIRPQVMSRTPAARATAGSAPE